VPTFEYKCSNIYCDNNEGFDKMVKKHDEDVFCPKCGVFSVKQLSAPSIGGMDKFGRSKTK
jgi:predicted nucleic acid-binding Zn ribbon protein